MIFYAEFHIPILCFHFSVSLVACITFITSHHA